MKIVILGAGIVGFQIAKQLIDENKNVVIIDRDMRVAKHASNYLDCMVVHDEGNNIEVLNKAGVDKADFFIAVTDSDELNMISCGLVSSAFKVPFKIARVRNLEYSRTQILGSPFLGIDHIVNPDIEASKVITRSRTAMTICRWRAVRSKSPPAVARVRAYLRAVVPSR